MKHLITADSSYLATYLKPRLGETKIGQQLQLPDAKNIKQSLALLQRHGARFVLLGIPEDMGPRANLGGGGADQGWIAFLSNFLNLQHNNFIKSEQLVLLGHVHCDDLQQQSYSLDVANIDDLATLRGLVETLDARVNHIIELITESNLIPIVIGGGHNNALPILQGTALAKNQSIAAVNLDPHTDFRALEGRHSGNGFSYAAKQGVLSHYFSLGIHQLKNSENNLKSLNDYGFPSVSIQEIITYRQISLEQAINKAVEYLSLSQKPVGLELDLDSIAYMPASAYTNAGFTLSDAQYYVHRIASLEQCCYLHLAEGAPSQHPAGIESGMVDIGNAIASLVCSFVQTKQQT